MTARASIEHQQATWTLQPPYVFARVGKVAVVVSGFVGRLWWRRRVAAELRVSDPPAVTWYWLDSGVALELAPDGVHSSLLAALSQPLPSEQP